MLRPRLEGAIAGLFATLTVVTVFWPDWIEGLTAADPDGGSGEVEVSIVVVLGVLTIVAAALARRDYRIASRRTGESTTP